MPIPDLEETRTGLEGRVRSVENGLLRLETTVTLFVAQATRLMPKIEALLEARSGEQAEAEICRRDVDRAHEKVRGQEARMDGLDSRLDRMEARHNKLWWMAVGGLGVLQFLWMALNWLLDRKLIGG